MDIETHNPQRQGNERSESAEALSNSDKLKGALSLPPAIRDEDWKMFLGDAFRAVEEPVAANMVNPTANRIAYAQSQHADIVKEEKACAAFFKDIIAYASQEKIPALYVSVVMKRIANLINAKLLYSAMLKEEKPKPISELPSYAMMGLMMAPESVAAELAPLRESAPSFLQRMDRDSIAKFMKAERLLTQKLQRAGMKNANVAGMLAALPLESAAMMEKVLSKATPNSYYDILILAYFLRESDDKAGAALNFATFLATQGMTQVVIEAAMANSRFAALRALPIKHPMLLAVVAVMITVGLDKAIGFDKVVKLAESKTDPSLWKAGGQAMEIVSGSKLIDDGIEVGNMTGLLHVDPQADLKSYLSRQLFQLDGKGLRKDYLHVIADWDEQVEAAAVEEEKKGNAQRAAIYRLSKIGDSGGAVEWGNREAVYLYRNVQSLRGMQYELNELVGLTGSAVPFNLADTAIAEQKNGDTAVMQLVRTETYQRINVKIDAIPDATKKKQARDLYGQCVMLARSIANDVSLCTHLGVYQESWTKERSEEGQTLLPSAVQKGMISILGLQARYAAIDPQYHEKKYAETLGKKLYGAMDRELPGIREKPMAWFEHILSQVVSTKAGDDINRRRERNAQEVPITEQMIDDIARIMKNTPEMKTALEPVLAMIEKNKNEDPPTMNLHDMQLALLHALADVVPDTQMHSMSYPDETSMKLLEKAKEPQRYSSLTNAFASDFAEKGGPSLRFSVYEGLAYDLDYRFQLKGGEWTVQIQPEATNPGNMSFRTGNFEETIRPVSIHPQPRLVPMKEWATKHPEAALRIQPYLEQHAQMVQMLREKAKTEYEGELKNKPRLDSIDHAKANPNLFVDIHATTADGPHEDKEWRSYLPDGSYISMVPAKEVVKAIRVPKSGMQSPAYQGEDGPFAFVWHATDGGRVQLTLTGGGFLAQENLDARTKELMKTALCTPMEGWEEASINKVLDAFRYETYIPNAVASFAGYEPRYFRNEIMGALLPLYRGTSDKKGFLGALFDVARDKNGVTEEGMPLIIAHMRNFQANESKRWENLYPVAKQAVNAAGTWIADAERQDEFKGRIEYICWPDSRTGIIYSQTTDGLDCRIHDPQTNRGIAQAGKYFDGVEHVLKDIPDPKTHEYDAVRRTWVEKR